MTEILLTTQQCTVLETALGDVPVRDPAGQVVGYVSSQNSVRHDSGGRADGSANMEAVRTLTEQMFPGRVVIETSVDPEFPTVSYVVFRVQMDHKPQDIDAIIDQELVWHHKVAEMAPESLGRIRLLVE